eukprot:3644065-Rhodomonas_salina.1
MARWRPTWSATGPNEHRAMSDTDIVCGAAGHQRNPRRLLCEDCSGGRKKRRLPARRGCDSK